VIKEVTLHCWLDTSLIDCGPEADTQDVKRVQEAFGLLANDKQRPLVIGGVKIVVVDHPGLLYGSNEVEAKILDAFLEDE
jgi:hypothetical protein